ncbi:hypothetical protein MBLNU230_g0601t1 [Neophaeotheca triangularis]
MQHVDRRELNTSLPARILYLHQFLEFGADDVAALIRGQQYVKTIIPAIVNIVYKKLLKNDITARVFATRDSRNEENPDRWPSENDQQIQNRKIFLRWYLTKLNSNPTKAEYWEYLDKVGYMHVGRGRRNPLHVDYLFLGACLGFIQDSMTEAILSHPRLDLQEKIAIVKAIGKVIWIQNDLLARWHTGDAKEALEELEKKEQTDAEGDLNGKKILGDSSSGSDGASTRSTGSGRSGKTSLGRPIEALNDRPEGVGCPFSGISH